MACCEVALFATDVLFRLVLFPGIANDKGGITEMWYVRCREWPDWKFAGYMRCASKSLNGPSVIVGRRYPAVISKIES